MDPALTSQAAGIHLRAAFVLGATTLVLGVVPAATADTIPIEPFGPVCKTPTTGIGRQGDNADDVIVGTKRGDFLRGGGGDDTIIGLRAGDCLFGERGTDIIRAGRGDDGTMGGDADDRLFGGSGSDDVFGEVGDDRIHGGPTRDLIKGGLGEDRLIGGRGADRIFGNAGDDRIEARDREHDRVACGGGHDWAAVDPFDSVAGCEQVRIRNAAPRGPKPVRTRPPA